MKAMKDRRYFNRELSWMEFNARVLDQAARASTPLLERLKFLSIVSSNFDEFFMVRVARIKSSIRAGYTFPDESGMSPGELLAAVSRRGASIVALQYRILMREILPELGEKGLAFVSPGEWTDEEVSRLEWFFAESVFPLLTPLSVGEGGMPSAGNLHIHAAFDLRDRDDGPHLAIVQIPATLDRFVRLPEDGNTGTVRYALLEDIVMWYGHTLFPGYTVVDRIVFKVTRDADLPVDEDRDDDFLAAMEEVLAERQNSWPVCLSVSGNSESLIDGLRAGFCLEPADVYRFSGPIDLRGFYDLASREGLMQGASELRDIPWPPLNLYDSSLTGSIWDDIRQKDRMLMVPYESFDPVVRFIEAAAEDPGVLAIKMTLYRTSGDSPFIRALIRAARNRKQVTVVVELKARFDEKHNISRAASLEEAGAIVVYGIARLKVHAKAILIVRKEGDGGIRRYLHLSTGNYNDKTARLYADISMFTAREELCAEASILFNAITGYSSIQRLQHLSAAPFDLKQRLLSLIGREASRSSPEMPGMIMAKMNSLVDVQIIDALYAANRAGVRILLNVRGICALVPGVAGQSENISVVSVVGRYLEHARVIRFQNGGAEELYLSSADWMPRNLERRVELMFPVLDEGMRGRIIASLEAYFRDSRQAYRLGSDGAWTPVEAVDGTKEFCAQEFLYQEVKSLWDLAEAPPAELPVRRSL